LRAPSVSIDTRKRAPALSFTSAAIALSPAIQHVDVIDDRSAECPDRCGAPSVSLALTDTLRYDVLHALHQLALAVHRRTPERGTGPAEVLLDTQGSGLPLRYMHSPTELLVQPCTADRALELLNLVGIRSPYLPQSKVWRVKVEGQRCGGVKGVEGSKGCKGARCEGQKVEEDRRSVAQQSRGGP
jgi:hypothetical protein